MAKFINTLNDNNLLEFSNKNKIPLNIIKSIYQHSKKPLGNYTNIEIPKNKKKIAFLISGAFFQNNHKTNYGHIKPDYNYKYILQLIIKHYGYYYDVDYYLCGDFKIDESIFQGKLKKSCYYENDKIPNLPNVNKADTFKVRRYSCQYFKKKKVFELIDTNIDYSFYIWSRCDWIWILNGYGMLDREITLHSTRPLPLIEKEKYENQKILFSNIDINKIYLAHSIIKNNEIIFHDVFYLSNYNNMKILCNAFDFMTGFGTRGLTTYLKSLKIKIDNIETIIINDKIDNNYHLPAMCGYVKTNCNKCDIEWCNCGIKKTLQILIKKYNL